MKKYILFLLVVISWVLNAQSPRMESYNKAIVWRGFSHLWSYNHRVNRIGSYVFLDSNQIAKGYHYSASGLGSDSTIYEQYYTSVSSPHLRFYQGSVRFLVTGRETQLLTESKEISVVTPEWFQNLERYKSMINGFEIKSVGKSDLPILFEMHIDDPTYSAYSREIKFQTNVNWVANCRSAECSIFSNTTTYEITLHYLIVGWNQSDALAFEFYNKKSYEWTINEEKPYEPIKKTFQVEKEKYENAFIGIKSIGFVLNEEQWLQEMKYRAVIDNYDAKRGLVYADIGMLFLDWKEGMKTQAVAKGQAMFSHKKPGWVSMSMNTVLIQSNHLQLIDGESTGSLYWRGKNKDANIPEAESLKVLKFKY